MGCEGRALQSLSRTRFGPKAACRTLCAVVRTSSPRDIARRAAKLWAIFFTATQQRVRRSPYGSSETRCRPPTCGAGSPRAYAQPQLSRGALLFAWRQPCPGLQRRPPGDTGQQAVRGDEQRFPREPVAALADRTVTVDFARSVLARGQPEMRADITRSREPRRVIDRRRKCKSCDGADPRSSRSSWLSAVLT